MSDACTYGYTGLSDRDIKIATLVLLCNGGGGGGGGGVSCGNYSGGQPTFTPSTSCAVAIDTSDGTIYWYYSGAWHP